MLLFQSPANRDATQFRDLWTAPWLQPHIAITRDDTDGRPTGLECDDLTEDQRRDFIDPDTPAAGVLSMLRRVGMKHQPNTTLRVLMTGLTQSGKTSFVRRAQRQPVVADSNDDSWFYTVRPSLNVFRRLLVAISL